MTSLLRESRHALRSLSATPAASLAAVLTLALGIGATTALFSVADATLFRPLPVADEGRLVNIVLTRLDQGGHYGVAYHNFLAWRERSDSFSGLAAARERTVTTSGDGGPSRLEATEVSPGFFDVLGTTPAQGRAFGTGDAAGGARAVILSDALWHRRFGADPQVLGRALLVDGQPRTVVGVMPPATTDPWLEWRDLWLPLEVDEAAALATQARGFSVLGRLAPGVTLEEARREMATLSRQLEGEFPAWNRGWGVEMHPVRWWISGELERPLLLLLAAVALVVAIACANVASLLLARSAGRGREMALRKALGASRWALARRLLAESLLLATAGGVAGLALAYWAVEAFRALAPADFPRLQEVHVDLRVLAVCLGLTATAGIASGLAPALRLAGSRARQLLQGGRGTTQGPGGRRLYALLTAGEIALAVTVVVGAGLLGRSLANIAATDPGLDPQNLLTLRLELPQGSYPDKPERIALFRDLLQRIEGLPGVAAAGASGVTLPMTPGQGSFELFVEGQPRSETPEIVVNAGMVSPGYFEALGIRMLQGRPFAEGETWESDRAAIVNQTMARRYWPGKEAVGRWVEWRNGQRARVVGVIADVRQLGLTREPPAEVYLAWGQADATQALVVRTAGDPLGLVTAVRREIQTVAPGTTVWDVRSGRELVRGSYDHRRFTAAAMGCFALLALALGVVGVYGVAAHGVGRRTREIGVRMALGALPRRVLAQVVGAGMRPVLAGLAVGLGLGLAASRLLASQLFGVAAGDPLSYAGAGLVVALAALAACALPARRAARVDPARVLRGE